MYISPSIYGVPNADREEIEELERQERWCDHRAEPYSPEAERPALVPRSDKVDAGMANEPRPVTSKAWQTREGKDKSKAPKLKHRDSGGLVLLYTAHKIL